MQNGEFAGGGYFGENEFHGRMVMWLQFIKGQLFPCEWFDFTLGQPERMPGAFSHVKVSSSVAIWSRGQRGKELLNSLRAIPKSKLLWKLKDFFFFKLHWRQYWTQPDVGLFVDLTKNINISVWLQVLPRPCMPSYVIFHRIILKFRMLLNSQTPLVRKDLTIILKEPLNWGWGYKQRQSVFTHWIGWN